MALALEEEGLYWFDVIFEEAVVTRMPLGVLYQRGWLRIANGNDVFLYQRQQILPERLFAEVVS